MHCFNGCAQLQWIEQCYSETTKPHAVTNRVARSPNVKNLHVNYYDVMSAIYCYQKALRTQDREVYAACV